MSDKHLYIFTDGGAIKNAKNAPGGSAVLIVNLPLLVSCRKFGTNNERELDALRYALRAVVKNYEELCKHFNKHNVDVYSDSEYSINVITGKYKAKANQDLIKKCQYYLKELQTKDIEITFNHVKAHTSKTDNKSFCNALVDKAANGAAVELSKTGEEKTWSIVSLSKLDQQRLREVLQSGF